MKKEDLCKPIPLLTSRAWRTYLGGKMICALHGEEGEDSHFPEEWLMSLIAARNVGREDIVEGPSKVKGTDLYLKDLVESYPEELLGEEHLSRCGKSLGVLVKLLDSAERLTIQAHPTRACAEKLFASPYGKTECWHIVGTREIDGEPPCIYLGFKEGITREKWKACFEKQDISAMLSCLHRIEVKVGDTFIVRGGVPHGIGAGCFLVEIQEPTDYTVRTERVTPSGLSVADEMCHQGLGFEKMFDCFIYEGLTLEETLSRYRVVPILEKGEGYTVKRIIYPTVTDMFALDLYSVDTSVTLTSEEGFCGVYVLSGKGRINGEVLNACDHWFLPAAADTCEISAENGEPLVFIRCFGPR